MPPIMFRAEMNFGLLNIDPKGKFIVLFDLVFPYWFREQKPIYMFIFCTYAVMPSFSKKIYSNAELCFEK